jgi:TolB protein
MQTKTSLYSSLLLLTAVIGIGCEKANDGRIINVDRIVYESNDKIYLIDADGSNNMQLTSSDRSYRISSHNWSSDRTKIIFSMYQYFYTYPNATSTPRERYTINTDGTGFTQITTGDNIEGSDLKYSPDGTQVVYQNDDKIYKVNSDGSNEVQLTQDNSSVDSQPDWSPDGTKIVFNRSKYGPRNSYGYRGPLIFSELYTINADGTGLTPLTTDSNIDERHPIYSPDGTQIAYSSWDSFKIYKVNSDGSNNVQLTHNNSCRDGQPDWSPDGTKIVFLRSCPNVHNSELYTMNADGTDIIQITDIPYISGKSLPKWQ